MSNTIAVVNAFYIVNARFDVAQLCQHGAVSLSVGAVLGLGRADYGGYTEYDCGYSADCAYAGRYNAE